MTASSGYDANTGEKKTNEDERELPSTVTLLVTPEQGNILASLEADGKTHLSLVYRGEPLNTKKFLDLQSKVLSEAYPKNTLSDKPENKVSEDLNQVGEVE